MSSTTDERRPLVARVESLSTTQGERKGRPPILPSAKSMPMAPILTPRTQYAKNVRLLAIVMISIVTSTANNIYFKKTVDAFKSKDPNNEHDYEVFVNQSVTLLYVMLPLSIVIRKRLIHGPAWWAKQHVPWQTFTIIGLMDCLNGLACTVGGAYTGGGMQNLLDQLMLPITLFFSTTLLGERFSPSQYMGSLIIIVGALVALLPTFSGGVGTGSTLLGIMVYGSSNFPSSFSGIYKEYAIKTLDHVDLYYLSMGVSMTQALFGFLLMPLMAVPAFGGIPLSEVPLQLYLGWRCFLGVNSQPGDDCRSAPSTMLSFVLWSFLYDISMLLITKEGSAALMVVSSALSLPVTNLAFACRAIAGESADSFNSSDVLALLLVSLGFTVYSAADMLTRPPLPGESVREPPPSSRVRRTFLLPHRLLCRAAEEEAACYGTRPLTAPEQLGKTFSSMTVQFSDAYGKTCDMDDLASSI